MARTLYIFDQGLKGLVGHYYEYVRSIVVAAEAVGLQCFVGCHEDAAGSDFASIELHPIFRDDVWATIPGEDYHAADSLNGVSARFLEDVEKLLADYPAKAGDIMFLPNIAKPHVVAAALIAERFGPNGVRTDFMFRYPSAHFEGAIAANAFRRLERTAEKYDVSLFTDSHRLAENLAPLTSLPFTVLPIPHTWGGLADPPVDAVAETDAGGSLHCVSLGNARDEKGIGEILEAVRLTANEPWGNRLRFTLQVNDPYQAEDAIQAFRDGPPDPRTTLVDESLGSDEYAALLASADVVLVPYWRSIYRERTSGVFLEGLITGKLVLCTRDTWMSDLFEVHGGGVVVDDRSAQSIYEGLRELVAQREALQERAKEAARYWKAIHCPENLVAHLSGEGEVRRVRGRTSLGGKAAILFPWGEAVTGKTGASLRLKYFVRYMETVYDDIRILFTGGGEPGGIIGKKSVAEPYHYSEETQELHEQLKAVCRKMSVPEEDCFHLWYHLWPNQDPLFALRCEELVLWADHIYVDYTYFGPIVDSLCEQHGKPYTMTVHDIVSEQAAKTRFLYAATRTLELDPARHAARLVCASEADRALLDEAGIEAEVIAHPIDAQEAKSPFSSEEARAILEDLYDLPLKTRRLCFFVGSFYPPNVEAAEAIAEMARRAISDPRLKDVLFVVAGACMKPCRNDNFISLGMIEGAGLSSCMSLADIILIPLLRGTGVSLKSIEALARGSLILSTTVGMRGIDVQDGLECHIEDDLAQYPQRIAEILASGGDAQRMRDAARQFGEKFDFRRLMALYVPGSTPAALAETPGEFDERRRQAIVELLPRLNNVCKPSPLLAGWKKQFAEVAVPPAAVARVTPTDTAALWMQEAARVPDDFDADWYLAAFPDVEMLGMDPAEHYAWIGRALGRAHKGNNVRSFEAGRSTTLRADATVSASRKRWFLADPSLVDNSGHCARYLLSVAKALRGRGDTVHILGNALIGSGATDLASCEPTFSLKCEEAPVIPGIDITSSSGIEQIETRRGELLRADLDQLAEKHGIGQSDVLLINSLRHWSLETVVDWLETFGPTRAPTVILVLHYTPHPNPGVTDPAAAAYEAAFRRIDRAAIGSKILLCTDSDRLRTEYRALYRIPITVLPVPHCSEGTAERPQGNKPLSFVFAGEARRDKGFDILPEAIRRVLNSTPTPDATFDVQTYRGGPDANGVPVGDFPEDRAVRLHPQPLAETEYEHFIESSDIILLPYLPGPYQAQTSGIYCEAAALGIPVVTSKSTWVADQVARNGGGILFEGGSARALADACIEAIGSYEELRETAERAALAWRAFHNPQNYITELDALIEGVPTAHAA